MLLRPSFERTSYVTSTYVECGPGSTLESVGPQTRESCEVLCDGRDDCGGFTLISIDAADTLQVQGYIPKRIRP